MWYEDIKLKNTNDQPINFTDWQKETVDALDKHKNIKKVWLVNNQRKTGATYFAKLLMFFRKPCTETFVISNNLDWSKIISRQMPIKFPILNVDFNVNEIYTASDFLKPVTLFGLEKEINKKNNLNTLYGVETHFECLYDNDFNIKTYNYLLSYNFDFFVINVSPKDLEKARPFIEADKDEEDVLIVNIETQLPNRNI